MQSCSVIPWVICFVCLITCSSTLEDGVRSKSNECDIIDEACNCFQSHSLRCHLNSSSHLRDVLSTLRNNSELSSEIRLLDLTVDRMSKLPAGLFGNLNLSGILVSNSRSLSKISEGAFSNGNLQISLEALKLPGNGFESLPAQLSELKNLVSLDMSENAIDKIDNSTLQSLVSLTDLNLGHNLLRDLKSVQLPTTLRNLNLQNNQITLENITMFNFGSLSTLDLSNNKLAGNLTSTSLGPIKSRAPNLTSLDLSYNALSRIKGGSFKKFPSLNKLDLSWNLLEILDRRCFDNLKNLTWLDLSHNRILELVGGTFRVLTSVTYLDLSFNHLQVLDGRLIQGLNSLEYFNLRSNSIFKVEIGALDNCDLCKTVLLTDNPLDCTCQLADFQAWLLSSPKLDQISKNSAQCATPTTYANAIIYDLPTLECENDSIVFDQISSSVLPPIVSLQKQSIDAGLLNLTWAVRLNYFTCQNLQVFDDESGNGTEIYSRPIECQRHHETPHGVDIVTTSLDLSKVVKQIPSGNLTSTENITSNVNLSSLLACLVVINEENSTLNPSVLSGCGNVDMVESSEDASSQLLSLSLLHATLNWGKESLAVFFRIYVPTVFADSCRLLLQVRNTDPGEEVLAHQMVNCSAQKFHFQKIALDVQGSYEVCAWLESDNQSGSFDRKCVNVEQEIESSATKVISPRREPILPLVLTLVFLFIGIALLVILYLIVKGYLSERQRPGFLPTMRATRSAQSGKFTDLLLSAVYWTSHWFSWKRRRRRGHVSVRQVDEMSLQDNMTVNSLVGD